VPNPKRDNLRSLIGNPCLFPYDLDEQSGKVVFVATDRDRLSRASFLDGRELFTTSLEEKRRPLKDLLLFLENQPEQKKPWNFIFHTGFCCSTLLARCLDQPGTCLSLKEPKILNSLSHCKKFSGSKIQPVLHHKKLELGLDLLFRKFSEKEKIIIKPSNVDLVLLDEILSIRPNSKLVFIYSDLKSFLISVAKGGQPRRDFVRRLLALLLEDIKTAKKDLSDFIGIKEELIWNLSDLHLAAITWHLQMRYLCEAKGKNIFWINCEEFLTKLSNILEKLKNFFDLPEAKQTRDFARLQKTLTRHAKAPAFSYNSTKREVEFTAINNYLSPVLPDVLNWAERVFPDWEKNQGQKIAV